MMQADERAIRDLVQTWLRASAAGDLDQVLALMSDDVVFLTPGQKPFGKEAFAAATRAGQGKVRIEGTSDIQEVQVVGDLAYCWVRLEITVSPVQGGAPKHLAGYSLSVLRKQSDGRWVIVRDANLVSSEPRRQTVLAVVPVFHVANVAKSIAWYRDVLGFSAEPYGSPEAPTFAILRRDGVELMLQKSCPDADKTRSATPRRGWSAYIRVADVQALREAVLARLPEVEPITTREYGCREFTVTDPDGHVLVLGQCC